MIKCPECGRQISDRAPFCPSCGVAIADKITKCPQCGEIYFRDQAMCPNCHSSNNNSVSLSSPNPINASSNTGKPGSASPSNGNVGVSSQQPSNETKVGETKLAGQVGSRPAPPSKTANGGKPKKKNYTSLIVAFVFAVIVCGVCFYFYYNAKASEELKDYEFAMASNSELVMQTYLDKYKDAPQEHIDSITAHLNMLKQNDIDWNNAVVSGSRQALSDYLEKHPDSEHKAEALSRIDSLDWLQAKNENTVEALNKYTQEHPDGNYIDEANNAVKELKAKTVQPEEKTLVSTALRRFFQSVNSRNEEALLETVAPILTSFLNKQDATKADVATFLNKIYKDDITNMNWHVGNDMKIEKKEVGDMQYEYHVVVPVSRVIETTDPNKEKNANYKLEAKINPDGLISLFNLTKVYE